MRNTITHPGADNLIYEIREIVAVANNSRRHPFFNGLGDAIAKIYQSLHPAARVIGPNPAYPTHSSAEAAAR